MLTPLTATIGFDFEKHSWSSAENTRRSGFEISKITLGFNKGATVGIEAVPRRGKGLARERRSDDYEWVLKSAHALPIIFHGSADRRAVQSDGEEAILHILLHRSRIWAAEDACTPEVREPLEGACPSQSRSVRMAMKSNAERMYRTATKVDSQGTREVLFKQEVAVAYHLLGGLKA